MRFKIKSEPEFELEAEPNYLIYPIHGNWYVINFIIYIKHYCFFLNYIYLHIDLKI